MISETNIYEESEGACKNNLFLNNLTKKKVITMNEVIKELIKAYKNKKTVNAKYYKSQIASILINAPKASNLIQLLNLCHVNNEFMHLVINSLRYVFEESYFEPGEVLMFPQRGFYLPKMDQNQKNLLQFETRASASFILDKNLKITIGNGMSISTWIRIVSNEITEKQHIVSIGNKDLKASAELCRNLKVLRITIIYRSFEIFKLSFPNVIKINGPWVNFVMGFQYKPGELRVFAMVGNHHRAVIKPMTIAIKLNSQFQISFGSRSSATTKIDRHIFCISSIFAFKGLLSAELSIILRAIGSACFSLTECRLSQIYLSLLNCLGRPIINSKFCDAFLVCSDPKKLLNCLQRLVLFTWRPCSAHCYSLNILQKESDFNLFLDHNDIALCLTSAKDYPVYWFSTVIQERCETLDKSIRTIGSIKIFIYLYALAVDKAAPIEIQNDAFRLLFVLLKREPSYYEVFNNLNGAAILVKILSSPNASINLKMCQTILNFIFTKLEKKNDGELYPSPRTAVVEPNFLRTLLSTCEIWKNDRFEYLARILCVTENVLSSNIIPTSFKTFNYKQLVQTHLLHQLLNIILEIFQNQEFFTFKIKKSQHNSFDNLNKSLSSEIDESKAGTYVERIDFILRDLTAELIGPLYRIDEIMQLWNFLLLSHPAQDTYFDYLIESHNKWIYHELLNVGKELEITGPFELSTYLNEILNEYGKEGLNRIWKNCEFNVIKVRRSLLHEFALPSQPTAPTSRRIERFTFYRMNSIDDSLTYPLQIINNEFNTNNYSSKFNENYKNIKENWLIETRCKLLDLMTEIVLNCQDSLMVVIESDVICWQNILVLLSNQQSLKIRTLIFTLLKNFFLRCSPCHRQSFVKKQGFLLLGSELKKAPVNSTIANALFSLTCEEHVIIRDGLDSAHIEQIVYDSFKLSSFYTLFSLFEESIYDSALFWSVCSTLQKFFMAENAPRRKMLECGLVNTMANVLWKICFLENCPPVDSPMFSLLDCWISFAQSIITFILPYKDNVNYIYCEDFLYLCIIAVYQSDILFYSNNLSPNAVVEEGIKNKFEDSLTESKMIKFEQKIFFLNKNEKIQRSGIKAMRNALSQLIYCWIDTIESILTDQFRPTTNMSASSTALNHTLIEDSDYEAIMEEDEENPWLSYYINYTNKFKPKEFASVNEMAARLLFGLNSAQNFFFHLTPPVKCSDQEETLFRFYIDIVLVTWKGQHQEKLKLNDEWQSVLSICRERAKILLAEIIAFILYPAQEKLQKFQNNLGKVTENSTNVEKKNITTIDIEKINKLENDFETTDCSKKCSNFETIIDNEYKTSSKNLQRKNISWSLKRRLIIVRYLAKQTVSYRYEMEKLLDVNLDYQYAMKIALHELALLPKFTMHYINREYDVELDCLIKFLVRIQIESPLANLNKEEINSLISDEILLLHSYYLSRNEFCKQISVRAAAICKKENNCVTSDTAMNLTCEIAEFQNLPRKLFIYWRKTAMNDFTNAGNMLENFIRELCHPSAAFFDEKIWPIGLTLETTETLLRERRRLTPQHYSFSLNFLKKEQREKVQTLNKLEFPLQNILRTSTYYKSLDHAEAINEVRLSVSAILLRTAFKCSGEIVVSDSKLYFLGENAKSTQKKIDYAPVTYSFKYDQIREIQLRSYLLKDTAMEIFTTTGDAFLIVFSTLSDRNLLINQLNNMNLNQLFVDAKTQLHAAVDKWRKGNLTNFEYLMILNKLAGRSFNDLMQYPVFPFILSDYTSQTLTLNSPSIYRDLSKPMAIQNYKMEEVYVQSYNNLLEEYNKSVNNLYSSVKFGPYHYGSHYSNTGIVAYYLVRVSPYTNVALEYQDNNFDIADRLFNSIETCWRLSSSESTTDFKELIPEFFFFPEMFQNYGKLDLGLKQNGKPVEDVILPPWCPRTKNGSEAGNSRLFCLIHRQALESSYVTSNLHHWIDLIFGYKQNGEAAIKAINLFHPATYRNRDLEEENLSDELALSAVRTMVRTYGQMPLTLFSSPHLPQLTILKSASQNSISNFTRLSVSSTSNAIFFTTQCDTSKLLDCISKTVFGLKWGLFVGSPELGNNYLMNLSLVLNLESTNKVENLTSVNMKDDNEICYGIPGATVLISYYKSDRKDVLRKNFEVFLTAIVSWNFPDNVLRIKMLKKNTIPWVNLIDMQSLELSKVAFSPSNNQLYLGFKCGLIRVFSLNYLYENDSFHRKWSIKLRSELFAHVFMITSLQVSDEFHVLLSTSIDGKICLWDTNRLEFLHQLKLPENSDKDETVTMSCISPTTADICICSQSGKLSRLVLFTINGEVVATHGEENTVSSLAITNMSEGTGINCLAVGFVTGHIKFFDLWTMNFVREISFNNITAPITSLLFTNNSQRLYLIVAGNQVLCLQLSFMSNHRSKLPSLKLLNPFL